MRTSWRVERQAELQALWQRLPEQASGLGCRRLRDSAEPVRLIRESGGGQSLGGRRCDSLVDVACRVAVFAPMWAMACARSAVSSVTLRSRSIQRSAASGGTTLFSGP